MSKRNYWPITTILVIMITLFVFSWLSVGVDFPSFQYSAGYSRRLIPAEPYDNIATMVSRFLWEYRALDLTGQAFVIVAAVVCCLAMLKTTEGGH